ncbi:MAG TPA: IS21 family transposase [Acidimicrobiales bacterium]|nr:IS21 family transposase [Acidimicrobiales bacterium]
MLRLWLDGRGLRAIAALVPPDRKTVTRVIDAAVGLGLDRDGGEGQLGDEFVGLVIAAMRPPKPDRHGESWTLMAEHHDKIAGWVTAGDVPERKMCELLARHGVFVPERTLNRYVDAKFPTPPRSTVRVADGEPGAELQVDFGELGMMLDEESGRRRKVWALVFTAAYSRHTFVWLSFSQTLATVITGFEEAWTFFGGVFRVVIPDNMATIVTNADACDPTLNQAFVEYAQSRGFVVDPARVRSPQDKPRVERTVAFVQSSFWAGEDFGCLAEAQVAAELWCRTRAGLRDHGTTHRQPIVVFDAEEAPVLLAAPAQPYDLPAYQKAKVHPDRHIQVLKALYSIPGELIGHDVHVIADTRLVKVFHRGQLIKCHPRKPAGGCSTDPADMPSEKTDYAMRDIESQKAKARDRGAAIGALVEGVLDGPLPWTRMRRVYRLFRAADRYGDDRVNHACERAVDAECVDVGVVIRMVERALEAEAAAVDPVPSNVIVGRFARDPGHFAAEGRTVTP